MQRKYFRRWPLATLQAHGRMMAIRGTDHRMIAEITDDTNDERCTVNTLRSHSCRWPIGDPMRSDFRFCGRQRRIGSPYCDEHHKGAFVKGDAIREIPA